MAKPGGAATFKKQKPLQQGVRGRSVLDVHQRCAPRVRPRRTLRNRGLKSRRRCSKAHEGEVRGARLWRTGRTRTFVERGCSASVTFKKQKPLQQGVRGRSVLDVREAP